MWFAKSTPGLCAKLSTEKHTAAVSGSVPGSVAVTVAVPSPCGLTTPCESMATTPAGAAVKVTVRVRSSDRPAASLPITTSCWRASSPRSTTDSPSGRPTCIESDTAAPVAGRAVAVASEATLIADPVRAVASSAMIMTATAADRVMGMPSCFAEQRSVGSTVRRWWKTLAFPPADLR